MTGRTRLALVTGASSGIGEATAHALATRGFHVLAGVRRLVDPDRVAVDGVEPVILDITDPGQVSAVAQRIESDSDGRPLAALVNNAGIAVNAPVEGIPMDEWRRQFEVNFFGHVAVIQALLPALAAGRGRIVNISSIGGRLALPTFGAYAGSKFALEGMSDSLRREVARFGVKVIVIEPGTVATPIWGKGVANAEALIERMPEDRRARYQELVDIVGEQAATMERGGIQPADAARVIADAIESRTPRARYLIGRDAKLMARVARILPDRAVDALIARQLRRGAPKSHTRTPA
jgi:NAD(P)-dependent dehydrogenase (short-subunit alcohol dehydrogenase family)